MQSAAPVRFKTGMVLFYQFIWRMSNTVSTGTSAMSAYMLSYCPCFFLNILRDSHIFRVGHIAAATIRATLNSGSVLIFNRYYLHSFEFSLVLSCSLLWVTSVTRIWAIGQYGAAPLNI